MGGDRGDTVSTSGRRRAQDDCPGVEAADSAHGPAPVVGETRALRDRVTWEVATTAVKSSV